MTRYRHVHIPQAGHWLLLYVTRHPSLVRILVGSAIEGSTPDDLAVDRVLFEEQCPVSAFGREHLDGLGLTPLVVSELVSWIRDYSKHPALPLHTDPGWTAEGDPPLE